MEKGKKRNVFWGNDYTQLFNRSTALEFFPTNDMTYNEKLNAVSRFFLYACLIAFMLKGNTIYLAILVIMLSGIYILSKRNIFGTAFGKGAIGILDPHKAHLQKKEGERITKNIENLNLNFTASDSCKGPTKDNPFMNMLPTDYGLGTDKETVSEDNFLPSCSHEEVREDVNDAFERGLYRDINDVYGRENSQRQFYTVANNNVPNAQREYASWLYGRDEVCKAGDTHVCTGYESGGPGGGPSLP